MRDEWRRLKNSGHIKYKTGCFCNAFIWIVQMEPRRSPAHIYFIFI